MIDTLVLIGLIAAVVVLWQRVKLLQHRIDVLEDRYWSVETAPHEAAPPIELSKIFPPSTPIAEIVEERPAPPPLPAESVTFQTSEEWDSAPYLHERPSFSFEEIFGRRLPIWAGGITLAVAGFLIVRYSIEAGLLSPVIRTLFGLLFGSSLLAAAELALRNEERVQDERVRQALAGAGIASLYGSILAAANLYDLIAPLTAFIGMAGVTALAIGLSLRFGAPCAVLGLVGGLAAPALVGSGPPSIPLLATYLALAVGGLSILSKTQRWMWLGVSALAGGLGWGAMLLIGGAFDAAGSISIALYLALIGIFLPAFVLPQGNAGGVKMAGSLIAAAQVAVLVATGGFTLLNWGLYGLISVAMLWLSRREANLKRLPAAGLLVVLLLLTAWPDPASLDFAIVMLSAIAIYGIPALLKLWSGEGSSLEAGQIAALALAGPLLALIHFYDGEGDETVFALLFLVSAFATAGIAKLGWTNQARRDDARFVILASATAICTSAAFALLFPDWALAPAFAGLALLLIILSARADDRRVEISGWGLAAAALVMLPITDQATAEFGRLVGDTEPMDRLAAFVRWSLTAVIAGLSLRWARKTSMRTVVRAVTPLLAYGAAAQFLSPTYLPVLAAAALVGLARLYPREPLRTAPESISLLVIIGLWAVLPLSAWTQAGMMSAGGIPLFVTDLPNVHDALSLLLVPAAVMAVALWPNRQERGEKVLLGVAACVAAIGLHILFKQLFAISSYEAFAAHGLAERTLWEAALLGGGLLFWKRGAAPFGLALSVAGLAHFGWFTLILHNPLWADQSVGDLPILNLLLPAYGLPLLWLWLTKGWMPEWPDAAWRSRSVVQMLLITLLGFSLLRQVAVGSILSVPGLSAGEDIARSLLAVGLAIGFLIWGIRQSKKEWRLASLALMLGAAGKVFLFDAAGLDGLLRIASFVALGLNLIGIGWLYSRYLPEERR
ncbi:DUF2339 domain-containing protein [Allosphingosinicella flava]|uniref:DUF2339 domain-containing protein n=1 Tax=Allosphingosinicella flava TaxID=2771430 RepID=A0A7T2GIC1_9SPHN|nr:DUF2339 domain-containing protein [Sphingosinicella flava]QPQ54379.1 DUF2339 domain-containing protein [Sphingosinicella flava]